LLGGPTASGKSEVGLQLAARVNGEIISVDSMQVYRGLDIGTAKPSAEERKRVRHHLVDIVDLKERFDAARFATLAGKAIKEIQARSRVPLLCGGTGLYFKALLEGLGEAPGADPQLRARLEQTPTGELLSELEEKDRATYERIDRKNRRRVIRAVEVIRLTGKPFSQQRSAWSKGERPEAGPLFVGLSRSAEDLRKRIDRRVEQMFERGLVAETEALLKQGLAGNATAMQALGYRQVADYLAGERSLPQTIALVKTRTWQYAKRQMTWFRRQSTLAWISADEGDTPAALADRIEKLPRFPRLVN
jgi:tRNA dimethylallyltransferase